MKLTTRRGETLRTFPMTATATTYVVRMVSSEGRVCFYTGKAGSGCVSENVADAFAYETLEGARRKAGEFNRMTAVHGFHAIGWEVPADA